MAKILDGKAAAAEVRSEVASEVAELGERGVPVRLDVILAGDDPASITYVASKERDSEEVGIESRVHRFSADVAQRELSDLVGRLNEDSAVSGFFIQLPLPEKLDPMPLISSISPAKDVDGLSPESVGRLAVGLPSLLPCTPHGVIQLLKRNAIELSGREAVVVGRSNLVGKPLAQLLLRENATVTLCHSRTRDLPEVTRRADILVVAAGKREMVGAEHVGEGAVVVDVGIHRKEEGGLVGDVRFGEVEPKAAWISPVPRRRPDDPGDAAPQHGHGRTDGPGHLVGAVRVRAGLPRKGGFETRPYKPLRGTERPTLHRGSLAVLHAREEGVERLGERGVGEDGVAEDRVRQLSQHGYLDHRHDLTPFYTEHRAAQDLTGLGVHDGLH
ncbi:MAG TPA: tetrahydrofolate dehydrogenase/cyclohydrolase catalytic domain-containing protein [Rubrobacter sp.]|nr:tetrahydrofolate dehydrogenase/cyclohydrolase catalytic domain-containing protein [Rubrobacter sp.]